METPVKFSIIIATDTFGKGNSEHFRARHLSVKHWKCVPISENDFHHGWWEIATCLNVSENQLIFSVHRTPNPLEVLCSTIVYFVLSWISHKTITFYKSFGYDILINTWPTTIHSCIFMDIHFSIILLPLKYQKTFRKNHLQMNTNDTHDLQFYHYCYLSQNHWLCCDIMIVLDHFASQIMSVFQNCIIRMSKLMWLSN